MSRRPSPLKSTTVPAQLEKVCAGRRAAVWGVVIFLLPIIGPAVYLVWETVRYRSEHGRPEKGMVEKYAPEEVAQRREDARQEESRRAAERGGDRDAAADCSAVGGYGGNVLFRALLRGRISHGAGCGGPTAPFSLLHFYH